MTPRYRVVFLGAGRASGAPLPPALVEAGRHRSVFDWLRDAYSGIKPRIECFVGGFGVKRMERAYPDLSYSYNPDWSRTGPLASLALAPLSSSQATFISYTDVVYRRDMVERMEAAGGDVVAAIDTLWRGRYAARSPADLRRANKLAVRDGSLLAAGKDLPLAEADAEFAGVLRVSASVAERLEGALRAGAFGPAADVPELLESLLEEGCRVRCVDVRGDWAELNAPQDLARFVLGTKAESLARLGPLLRRGIVDELLLMTRLEWERDAAGSAGRVRERFGKALVAVRSSSTDEDQWSGSAAGRYRTVLSVPAADPVALRRAVGRVFGSYRSRGSEQQVLIQRMVAGVVLSGVVTTRTPDTGGPYYTFHFDADGGSADGVTSGRSRTARHVFLKRGRRLGAGAGAGLRRVLAAVKELEALVGHDSLDVEFAADREGRVHVLQVRPLAQAARRGALDEHVDKAVAESRERFRLLQRRVPHLHGERTLLSSMADWNPAEIIGAKPSPLAFALYRHIVTDETWARQRAEYGYADARPANLLVDLAGHPYVDVRADFNSFLPAGLPPALAEKLVAHYLGELERRPALHDKVEFEVVLSCLSPDFEGRAGGLRSAGVTRREADILRGSLASLTRRAIAGHGGRMSAVARDDERLGEFSCARGAPLKRAFLLIEQARLSAALSFAHVARDAFVAMKILKDLVESGNLDAGELERFLRSLRTVPSRLLEDARRLSFADLVLRYGHLRPGTYDVCAPTYAERPEVFLRPFLARGSEPMRAFRWSRGARSAAERWLRPLGLGFPAFAAFARSALEGREEAKFVLSKYVSAGLDALAEHGRGLGLSRRELSFLTYQDLMGSRRREELTEAAELGAQLHAVTTAMRLPSLIRKESDFTCIEHFRAEPNFITSGRARGRIALLEGGPARFRSLAGRIVVVPNADPGYDWIFGHRIAGLVTMYGGVNSHMAIRVAELGIPAAIGVGEPLYETVTAARAVELDCAARLIVPI